MYSGYAGSGNEEDGDEAKQMSKANEQSIHHHGAGPVCWDPSGVDVYGKCTFEYGTDCMLNEVRRQVVECACMMGPC